MNEFQDSNNFLCYRGMIKKYKSNNIVVRTVHAAMTLHLILIFLLSKDVLLLLPALIFGVSLIFCNRNAIWCHLLCIAADIFLPVIILMELVDDTIIIGGELLLVMLILSLWYNFVCIQDVILNRALSKLDGYPFFDEHDAIHNLPTDGVFDMTEPVGSEWRFLRYKIRHFKKPVTLKVTVLKLVAIVGLAIGICTFIPAAKLSGSLSSVQISADNSAPSLNEYFSGSFPAVLCTTLIADNKSCYWTIFDGKYICAVVPNSICNEYDNSAEQSKNNLYSAPVSFIGKMVKFDGQPDARIEPEVLKLRFDIMNTLPDCSVTAEDVFIEVYDVDAVEKKSDIGLIITFISAAALVVLCLFGRKFRSVSGL